MGQAKSSATARAAGWLVVGLGNPGGAFSGTVHNAGADVVARLDDALARARSSIARARTARKIILDRSRARARDASHPPRAASPSRARVETPSRRSARVRRGVARDDASRRRARSRVRAFARTLACTAAEALAAMEANIVRRRSSSSAATSRDARGLGRRRMPD